MRKRVMPRNVEYVLMLLLGCAFAGCSANSPDYHILKCGLPYDKVIANPYEWSLMQLADGPVSGPEVSDYARIVIAHGLEETTADLNGNGVRELLIRENAAGRVWTALCFAKVRCGYRYMGALGASVIVPPRISSDPILVYEACGGHYGFIKKYRHNGTRFESISTEDIRAGDGCPEENNRRLERLFHTDEALRWKKVPDATIGSDVQRAY